MFYTLYCSKDRFYTLHSVVDDEESKIQTIKCLFCNYEQKRVILGRRVSVSKSIYEEYEKDGR